MPERDRTRLAARARPHVRTLYRLSELAVMVDLDRKTLRRVLDRKGVRWECDDPRIVSLTELRRVLPNTWDSMLEAIMINGESETE